MSRLGIYALEATRVDPATHQIETLRSSKEFVGEYQEVATWAQVYLDELSKDKPGIEYKVEPVLLEALGPRAKHHLVVANERANTNGLMAQILAGQVAALRARDQLELNPDLSAQQQKVLAEASNTVAQIQAQTAKREAGVSPDVRLAQA